MNRREEYGRMEERNYGRERGRTERTVVEHTSPIWRLVTVSLISASIAAFGFYCQRVGRADDFATILVITLFFGASFWARKRPDQVQTRFGPFAKIALAVRESADDVRQFVYERPLRVGFAIAAGYGIAVVLAKYAVVAILQALYSWELAVAFGAAVGAVAVGGDIIRRAGGSLFGGGAPPPPAPESRPGRDEAGRRRSFRLVEDPQDREDGR